MGRIGIAELVVVLLIVLIFGGYKVIPKMATEFKRGKQILKGDQKGAGENGEAGDVTEP